MVHQNNKTAFFFYHVIKWPEKSEIYCVLAYPSLLKHCTGVWVDANVLLCGCYGVLCGC